MSEKKNLPAGGPVGPPRAGAPGPWSGAPEGALRDPRRWFRYEPGTDWDGTGATFYDCFGLFEHILTDFEISRFVCTPLPALFLPSLDRCDIANISLGFRDFAKIREIFEDCSDTFRKRARVYQS